MTVYSDGRVYFGEHKDNRPVDCGEISYPDGSRYVGMTDNGKKDGHGKFYKVDGSEHIGTWKKDAEIV